MPCSQQFTIDTFIRGEVRNVTVPDNALLSICYKAEVTPGTPITECTKRQCDLSRAWLYVWLSTSPQQSGGYTEKDDNWQKSENGEQWSKADKDRWIRMANDIFEEYGLEKLGKNSWGMVGNGFHNIRRTS